MHRMLPILLVACGGATPPAGEPTKPPAAAPSEAESPPIDAAAPAIDAGPPAELLAAPAWIFRYDAPPRVETWSLRHHDGAALVEVTTAQGTTRYLGTATEGATLALEVSTATTPPASMKLDCKPATRAIGVRCNDAKAKPIAVLDCFHPDFAAPMTFAAAPGVEYDASCGGYRTLP